MVRGFGATSEVNLPNLIPLDNRALDAAEREANRSVPVLRGLLDEVVDGIANLPANE